VTVAVAVLRESAALATTTWQTAGAAGAVKMPIEETDPHPGSATDQSMALFDVPVTAPVNATVPPTPTLTSVGAIVVTIVALAPFGETRPDVQPAPQPPSAAASNASGAARIM
jgi:hypothetical protein